MIFKNLQWCYCEDISTDALALIKGDIDAFVTDSLVVDYMASFVADKLSAFTKLAAECGFSLIFKKAGPYTELFSESIREMKKNGTIEQLKSKWFSGNEEKCVLTGISIM